MTFFLIVIAPILALCLSILGIATLLANRTGWFLLVMGLAYLVGGPTLFVETEMRAANPQG